MTTDDLFYPDIKAEIGGYIFSEGITIEAYQSSKSYFDWAKVKFTSEYRDKISLNKKDDAVIQLGYNGNYKNVFTGYLSKPYDAAGDIDEILCKDGMILLDETYISNTFLDAAPQEIIKYCLSKAGVSNYKISSDLINQKPKIPIYKKNVISVLNEINSIWGISKKFFFDDGVFYWGTAPDQTSVYEFLYGENIISLSRDGSLWKLETVSAPFIKKTNNIKVTHPRINGTYEVIKIAFKTNDTGFIRTYIYF